LYPHNYARKYGEGIDVERWREWLAYEESVIANMATRTIHG
jgi:tRNA-(ms[2]io[6]A)-hydroxylase